MNDIADPSLTMMDVETLKKEIQELSTLIETDQPLIRQLADQKGPQALSRNDLLIACTIMKYCQEAHREIIKQLASPGVNQPTFEQQVQVASNPTRALDMMQGAAFTLMGAMETLTLSLGADHYAQNHLQEAIAGIHEACGYVLEQTGLMADDSIH